MDEISLLIIDDSQEDVDLILRALRSGEMQIHSVRVEGEVSLRKALENQHWDLLVSDYMMPALNAFKVLEVVRELRPLLPVVVVSGWIDVNMAVLLMKEGARDFVQKSELVRLPGAIEKALKEVQLERENQAMVQALAESERRLAEIIDCLPDATLVINDRGQVILWNRAMEKMTGVPKEQILGRGEYEYSLPFYGERRPMLIDLVLDPGGDKSHFEASYHQMQRDGETLIGEVRLAGSNHFGDRHIWGTASKLYDAEGNPVGAIQSVRDVTERKHMEEIMIQTEKMMSVGGLAAGMAHEINNPLGGIMQGNANIKRRLDMSMSRNRKTAESLGLDPRAVEAYIKERQVDAIIESVSQAGARAASIVNTMLQFSRRSNSKKELVYLPALADETLELAAKDYDLDNSFDFRHIKVIRDYSDRLPPVYCVPNEIQQVVLNLLLNAAQALRQHPQPGVTPQIILGLKQRNNSVIIEVEDNGPGMDEQVKKRIFEPFYTTKDVGRGTGLGLSVSYFIIKENHQGQMQVQSQPGRGARFIVKLPVEKTCPGGQ